MAAQKFGLTIKKEEDFAEWYIQVIQRGELLDYYNIKGCFIMRPASMFMWSEVRKFFDSAISKMGVLECYFPLLVGKKQIEQEKAHLENFNPELAWITKCGDKELPEHVAIRPTSETIMYPSYAKWLKTYRDLPLKLNQWCNVLRWEVKSTFPFIRGREFLWQEGHTAYYDQEEAHKETYDILELYAEMYKKLLAVPVLKGRKSAKETFGGADYTLSVEAFIPGSGKAVQAATSHHLGTNFAKMFDIKVETETSDAEKRFVYQNSWGLTTRSLGIAVMIHSDNNGFVCPPVVSPVQIIIIPVGISATTTQAEYKSLFEYTNSLRDELSTKFRVQVDERTNNTPGFKYNHWEIRGVPIRLVIGFQELKDNKVFVVRRDTGKKSSVGRENINETMEKVMEEMQSDMYAKAEAERDSRIKHADSYAEFEEHLSNKNIVLVPWCEGRECEDAVAERTIVKDGDMVILTGAKTLCIPFEGAECKDLKCIICQEKAKVKVYFGRSY
ncbi:bifunctional glutamyl/prolyl-tRNA synthetase [Enteropsectra breve]|nr:bifunctional glutamyl/prolyl-tRNA synthetase [Enteropsectra breve]